MKQYRIVLTLNLPKYVNFKLYLDDWLMYITIYHISFNKRHVKMIYPKCNNLSYFVPTKESLTYIETSLSIPLRCSGNISLGITCTEIYSFYVDSIL